MDNSDFGWQNMHRSANTRGDVEETCASEIATIRIGKRPDLDLVLSRQTFRLIQDPGKD